MELTQGSETSANYNLTPGKYPKEYIQYHISRYTFKHKHTTKHTSETHLNTLTSKMQDVPNFDTCYTVVNL